MLDYLPAITLHRPYPWAIFHAGKNYENRGYPLPEKYLDQWVAIHAGQRYNQLAADDIERGGYGTPLNPHDDPTGIIGLVRFDASFHWVDKVQAVWFTGPWGWHITDRLLLAEPIPILGKQGFWKVPPGAASFLREKINTAGVTP